MSTHSTIIERIADGTYRGIYCHFDGYPKGVGATLLQHYADPAKVSALIDLGDISQLGERVAPTPGSGHTSGKAEPGVTVAYARDRGETGVEPTTRATPEAVNAVFGNDFIYVFEGGKWLLNGEAPPDSNNS